MIVLDTHIWVWWVHDPERLTFLQREMIESRKAEGVGVSAMSCWEVAKLVEYGRLTLPAPVSDWFMQALSGSGIKVLPLSPEIAVASTQLPDNFHRDPADQIIVATARWHDYALITSDRKILHYAHVKTVG